MTKTGLFFLPKAQEKNQNQQIKINTNKNNQTQQIKNNKKK